MIQVGDPAPEFTLETLDGGELSLAQARRGLRAVILVFLRHLG